MSHTLYLVDDHAVLRGGLRALLEPAGYTVVGEGGDVASVLPEIVRLEPDVVLVDLSLGERSGIELLAEMQRRKLPSRALVLTMIAQPRQVSDAVQNGALGYVLKGASGSELIAAIGAVAAGRYVWSPAVAAMAQKALSASEETTAADPLNTLSLRERQVLGLVVRGRSSAVIAETLHLSVKTVETYRSRLMSKLGIGDITELVRFAIREGILDAGEE
ncbi:response regulator transcription factor [Niveibacterium sp. SC-1]|uniref:response regulator transcription factor n=1 Tax=Niveibacterium sp. SC-1 TaxID=3135646 RepID=UPI00311ED4DB